MYSGRRIVGVISFPRNVKKTNSQGFVLSLPCPFFFMSVTQQTIDIEY